SNPPAPGARAGRSKVSPGKLSSRTESRFSFGPDRRTYTCRELLRRARSRYPKIPRLFDFQLPTSAICRRCWNSRSRPKQKAELLKQVAIADARVEENQLASAAVIIGCDCQVEPKRMLFLRRRC